MIPDSFLEELKQRCDIESLISSYVLLKRAGRNLKGLCPFHSEKTPSFVVYPESQSFYCFGCGAGGDAISFIMRAENLEYIEAVKFLAEKAGLPMPENTAEDRTGKRRMRILEMNREAARFFHRCLVKGEDRRGLEYLANRGMDKKMIIRFGLGYAPDSWNALRDHLQQKGYSWEEMLDAALVIKGRNGSVYDTFRGRVIFPIIDLRGNVIGFGGRVLSSDNAQKLIDLLLILEIAHLLSAVELHDQIGQRGENALAGKAALAHRNALVHTRYHGKRNIIPPVNKKAVQIEGMPADAARTDFPTGFFILGKPRAERIRFQHFPSPRNYRYGWPQPTAQRNGRLQQCYYIQADFFALRFLVARMNSASRSAANTIPIGYATAVL